MKNASSQIDLEARTNLGHVAALFPYFPTVLIETNGQYERICKLPYNSVYA